MTGIALEVRPVARVWGRRDLPDWAGPPPAGADPIGQDPTRAGAAADTAVRKALAMPSVAQNTDDPAFFNPLRSQPVKDAIYRALRSGQTQRWQDGKLSGYAVPSGG